MSSVDNFCEQAVPRSEQTQRQSRSGSNPLDTQIVFLKTFVLNFAIVGRQERHEILPSMQRVKGSMHSQEHFWFHVLWNKWVHAHGYSASEEPRAAWDMSISASEMCLK